MTNCRLHPLLPFVNARLQISKQGLQIYLHQYSPTAKGQGLQSSSCGKEIDINRSKTRLTQFQQVCTDPLHSQYTFQHPVLDFWWLKPRRGASPAWRTEEGLRLLGWAFVPQFVVRSCFSHCSTLALSWHSVGTFQAEVACIQSPQMHTPPSAELRFSFYQDSAQEGPAMRSTQAS